MERSERPWMLANGVVACVIGLLWLAGTAKTDPGFGRGLAHDIGNAVAFYWMPVTVLAFGIGLIGWTLFNWRDDDSAGEDSGSSSD